MPIKNWFYLRKDAAGLQKDTIENPSDTYVNIVDVDSPNSGNIMRVSDFIAQSRPYKVYTALLTQIGGNDPQYQQSGPLMIGVTYYIDDNAGNPDFTNVGAPNNNAGTYFVATGTTPNSWGEAGLEYNTAAPVATVLENTLGNVWFNYNSVGIYNIYSNALNPLFTENKTLSFIGTTNDNASPLGVFEVYCNNTNQIQLLSFDMSSALINGLLYNTPIEIRVYN